MIVPRETCTLPVKRNSISTSEDEVNNSEASNSLAGNSQIQWDYFNTIHDLEITPEGSTRG